jgi:hypothetical protein
MQADRPANFLIAHACQSSGQRAFSQKWDMPKVTSLGRADGMAAIMRATLAAP